MRSEINASALITGANRGLGLEHARQYVAKGWRVFATCRDPSSATELNALAQQSEQFTVLPLEVTDFAAVDALADQLGNTPIDVLINNAGIFGHPLFDGMQQQRIGSMDYEIWREVLEVNLLAPFKITEALLKNVARSHQKKVVMMSSEMGSIGHNTVGGSQAYRSSKAALNMVSKCLAIELAERSVTVVALGPGWCRTDMGTDEANLDTADSVHQQQDTIARLTLDDSGSFVNYTGAVIGW